jgi:hypothetical protein
MPMLTYLRYALATFCFAASVGCLALWWRSMTQAEYLVGPSHFLPSRAMSFGCASGCSTIGFFSEDLSANYPTWKHIVTPVTDDLQSAYGAILSRHGLFQFSAEYDQITFPVWYPALIFTLAGVAVLRLGRRFTLRSAIIATTVVAGLLGMVVAS